MGSHSMAVLTNNGIIDRTIPSKDKRKMSPAYIILAQSYISMLKISSIDIDHNISSIDIDHNPHSS